MKFMACILAATMSLPAFAQDASDPAPGSRFDLAKINGIIAQVLANAADGAKYVKEVTVKFDENYTNLDQDKVKLDSIVKAEHVPWSTQETTVYAEITANAETDSTLAKTDVNGNLVFGIKTETTAMANHFASGLYTEECDAVDPTVDPDNFGDLMDQVACSFLLQVIDSKNVQDIAESVKKLQNNLKRKAVKFLNDNYDNPDVYKGDLRDAETAIQVSLNVKIDSITNANGDQGFSINLPVVKYREEIPNGSLDIKVFEDEASLGVKGTYQVDTANYLQTKAVVEEVLVSIQDDTDPKHAETLAAFELYAKWAVGTVEELVTDGNFL